LTMLVSTSRGIVRYDERTRSLQSVLPNIRETYGISWTPDGTKLVVACTSGGSDHALSFDDLAGYARSEVGTLVCNGTSSPGCLSAPHQIACIDGTYTLVANSGRNAIAKMRLDDWCVSMHRVDDVYWDRFDPSGKPGLHLNSVYYKDGVAYAVAHNFHRGSRVFALSWPSLAVVQSWHFSVGGMHNVALLDGRLLVCDSLNGCVVDALTGATVWANGATGMTRGLAASEDRLYIGCSAYADRDSRANSSGGIWVLDRATFEPIEYVVLSELGGVNEIRLTNGGDSCHHGFPLAHHLSGSDLPSPDVLPPEKQINRTVQAFHQQGWRVVSGTPDEHVPLAAASMRACEDGLVVAHVSAHCQSEISGTFVFADGAREVHASLVVDYRGPGDTCLVAGMLRRTDHSLIASIWEHAGAWNCLASVPLPPESTESQTAYHVTFRRLEGQYLLAVNGEVCLRAPAAISDAMVSGSVGARLSGPGVTVRDLATASPTPPAINQH
jgi:hypothetical protein